MDRDSIEGWHRWFGFTGVVVLVLGLAAQEWVLAGLGAALAAYSFGMLAVRRYRRRSAASDESDSPTPSGPERLLPRRNLIWSAVLALLAIGWSAATHSYSELWVGLFALGVVALILWWRVEPRRKVRPPRSLRGHSGTLAQATVMPPDARRAPRKTTPRQTGLDAPRVVRSVIVARRVVGVVLVLTGVVWIGQGTRLIQGSSMTGSTFWAIVGGVCFAAGLGLLGWPWRQSHAEP